MAFETLRAVLLSDFGLVVDIIGLALREFNVIFEGV
jgi:hypothetical protein